MDESHISIIVPAYNEESTIGGVLEELRALFPDADILAINDGSTDSTGKIADSHGVNVIDHETRRGYGASLKTGIEKSKGDVIAFIDADGQHGPSDIIPMLELIKDNDMVVAQRENTVPINIVKHAGKWILNFIVRVLGGLKTRDINCGLRVLKRDVIIRYLSLLSDGFSFSTTTILTFERFGQKIAFYPVSVNKRRKKDPGVGLIDGLGVIWSTLRLTALYFPMRTFGRLSILFFLVAGLIFLIDLKLIRPGVEGWIMFFVLLIVLGVLSLILGVFIERISVKDLSNKIKT